MANRDRVSNTMKNSNFILSDKMNELLQFFSAYFHQDWNLEAAHPDEVVHAFMKAAISRNNLINLASNIEIYADSKPDDDAAEIGLFNELGCYYLPSADGIGAKAWLYHVASLLRSSYTPEQV